MDNNITIDNICDLNSDTSKYFFSNVVKHELEASDSNKWTQKGILSNGVDYNIIIKDERVKIVHEISLLNY